MLAMALSFFHKCQIPDIALQETRDAGGVGTYRPRPGCPDNKATDSKKHITLRNRESDC